MLMVVLHDQSDAMDDIVASYDANLRESSLPDAFFYGYDSQHRCGGYAGLYFGTHKMELAVLRYADHEEASTYEGIELSAEELDDIVGGRCGEYIYPMKIRDKSRIIG